jgi:hypothetical protein
MATHSYHHAIRAATAVFDPSSKDITNISYYGRFCFHAVK